MTQADDRCPICDAPVAPDAKSSPFCTTRCKLIDLGRWADGKYAVPDAARTDDEEASLEERDGDAPE